MYTKGQTRRFADALAIVNPGACNPSGIAHSLVDAFKEIADENGDTAAKRNDPAVRLMVHQLAFICGAANLDNSYGELVAQCEAHAVSQADLEDRRFLPQAHRNSA